MGTFVLMPFLLGFVVPAACMVAVVILLFTRMRSSLTQLVLSLVCMGYGICLAQFIAHSMYFSPLLSIYALPILVGALGLLTWLRARSRRNPHPP